MVGIGLALALRERSPLAATLLVVGLAVLSAGPLATAALQSFWLAWSPGVVGGVLLGVKGISGLGMVLAMGAAAVGRPPRDREEEP